ncbi:MAG: methylenetetrahydrofolate reductase [Armatimonadota bacterium]
MDFKQKIKSGQFVITTELAPSKGTDTSYIRDKVDRLHGVVDAINVTDNQRSIMRASPIALSHVLVDFGIEPILQLTCRDRNRLALQSDLLGAHWLGIRNVLALTGDHPSFGDHKGAKSVFDIDSVQLLAIIRGLNNGIDDAGNKLTGSTHFFSGAAVNPFSTSLDIELIKMKKKIEQGAAFFQTQTVYDADVFIEFMDRAKQISSGVKIIAGIMPIESLKMAKFMRENIPGIVIPDTILKELEEAENPLHKGIEQTSKIIEKIRNKCAGVHIMTRGKSRPVIEIMKLSGLYYDRQNVQ